MTAVDVDALDKLREAADIVPMRQSLGDLYTDQGGRKVAVGPRGDTLNAADAVLIVAAVNALPDLLDLLAEVRRGRALREQHDELRGRLKALVDEWDAMARNLHHIPVAEAYADVVIGLRAVLAAGDGGGQR